VPPNNLANIYAKLGEYEKALHLRQESLKLEPDPITYLRLIGTCDGVEPL
jgi:tetratricopeptide (TPR) repeat protein